MAALHELVRRRAEEIAQVDGDPAHLREGHPQQRVRAGRMQPHAEDAAAARRRLDHDRRRELAGEARHRAELRTRAVDQAVALGEMQDQIEPAVRERPLARMRRFAVEIAEALHHARQVRRTPFAVRPAAERGIDAAGDDAHRAES